ncbi:MAG: LuxR family transcriptional regulator [Methyloligellaceae bacterium]
MTSVLDRFLEDLAKCDTVEGYKASYRHAVADLGFAKSAYVTAHLPSYDEMSGVTFSQTMVMTATYPEDWRQVYRDQDLHLIDPVLKESRTRVLPFLWEELLDSGKLGAREKEFMDTAHDFGLANGFTIPIHGPKGEFALVSLTCEESEAEFHRLVQSHKHALHICSIYYHEAIQELATKTVTSASGLSLTPREAECLKWTARGKSSWETSVLLTISERTVNFHLANAMRKLGVYNKTHAVAKAVSLGLTHL